MTERTERLHETGIREATGAWAAISLQTFGGPAGQIAVMHREFVERRRWIGEQRFLHALSFCTLLPGPEAQQLATYLGRLLNGTVGGLIAGTLFVVPGFVAILVLSVIYARFGDTTAVSALFAGVAPAVLVIVAQAVRRVSARALKNNTQRAIAVGSFLALFLFSIPFPIVVIAAAACGLLRPHQHLAKPSPPAHNDSRAPLIADDALHVARRSARRTLAILVGGACVWVAPLSSSRWSSGAIRYTSPRAGSSAALRS